jgi:hypothetical protein
MVKEMRNLESTTLYVDFDHVLAYSQETADAITLEYYR